MRIQIIKQLTFLYLSSRFVHFKKVTFIQHDMEIYHRELNCNDQVASQEDNLGNFCSSVPTTISLFSAERK